MSSPPVRSPKSGLAESLLKDGSYDLFLFIEDEKLVAVYTRIIRRILDQKVRIGGVYPMKSKDNVLKEFYKWEGLTNRSNKCVFIIDRDFDRLKGLSVPNHPNLIELEYYTIENYLLTLSGTIELVQAKISNIPSEEIEEILKWQEWQNYINEGFKHLFIAYAIAHKYSSYKNCSISPHVYLQKGSYDINKTKVDEYIDKVKKFCEENDIDYSKEVANIQMEFIDNGEIEYEKLIKGKYKHSALFKYINSLFNKKFDEDLANVILADNISINSLSFMKNKLVNFY